MPPSDAEQISDSIINIQGEKVALGPLRRELLPLYQAWINDFAVTRTLLFAMRPVSAEAEEQWYLGASGGLPADSSSNITFTAYERPTLRPVGTSGLTEIDHRLRRANFGIVLGARDCWGKGYGTETARLVLEYGFTALNLHNIMLTTQSFNERAIRAYMRAGFREFGRRREAHWLAGRAYDVVYMDCLASEFDGQALRALRP